MVIPPLPQPDTGVRSSLPSAGKAVCVCMLDLSFCLTTALNRAQERPPAGSTFQTAHHMVRAGHQAWHRLSIYLEPIATRGPVTWRAGAGSAVTNTWTAHRGHARMQAQQHSVHSTPPTCVLGFWVPEGKASHPREEVSKPRGVTITCYSRWQGKTTSNLHTRTRPPHAATTPCLA